MSVLSTATQQESQPKPEPQLYSEKELVDKIKALRNPPSPLTKDGINELIMLVKLHEMGKGVGYTTVKLTPTLLEQLMKALRKEPFPLTKYDNDKLEKYEKLHEKRKAVGYAIMDDYDHGNVFYYAGNCLYTCSHVVLDHGIVVLDRLRVVFKWIDLDKEETVQTHKYPRCSHLLPCKHSHRAGIFKHITKGGLFRQDKIDALQLPSNQFKCIAPCTYKDDMLYHIYWDFDSDIPTKKFCILKQTTSSEHFVREKDTGPCVPFNSPATDGASGSPVMVYQTVDDPEKEFCLLGVISRGGKYTQQAKSPASIEQLSKMIPMINMLQDHLVNNARTAKNMRDRSLSIDEDFRKMIIEELTAVNKTIKGNLEKSGLQGIFFGSLRIAEP